MLIRPARPADVPVIHRFVRELAAFEQAPDAVESTEAMLAEALFGPSPAAEALIAERDNDDAVGFAIFYPTFSTWTGRRGSGSTTSTSPPRPAAAAPAPPC